MKWIILTCICFFFCLNFEAKETITLFEKNKDRNIDTRSLSQIPVVTYDNNAIHIHSDIPLENMQITIKDTSENVILTYSIVVLAGQDFCIFFTSSSNKEFIIELKDKFYDLYGYFIIH